MRLARSHLPPACSNALQNLGERLLEQGDVVVYRWLLLLEARLLAVADEHQ